MVNVKDLKTKPVSEIVRILEADYIVPLSFENLSIHLNVSILPYDFGKEKIDGKKILCAFVTNPEGKSCFFYDETYLSAKYVAEGRIVIARALAKYIITGENKFYITESTVYTNKEMRLTYELLMPESQVRNIVNKLLLPTVSGLANIFQVSEWFVKQRLNYIDLPSFIIGYDI